MGICGSNKDNITREEFNSIVNPLTKSNDTLRDENDKLKRQLKQFQVFASQNINNNNPQNMMPLIGGVNFNMNYMNYNNRITFVFIDGSQCIIFINNITKLSEVLQELRIQRENLPNINNLRFVNNGIDITQSFQQDCLIRKLNLCGPILVLLQRRN